MRRWAEVDTGFRVQRTDTASAASLIGLPSKARISAPGCIPVSFAKTLEGHKSRPVTMLQARPHAIHFKRILDFGEGHGLVDLLEVLRGLGRNLN
jgi:hypothetical protein